MIVLAPDAEWPSHGRWLHYRGERRGDTVPNFEPLSALVSFGLAKLIRQGVDRTTLVLLLGRNARRQLEEDMRGQRMVERMDGKRGSEFMGLPVRWLDGDGIEILSEPGLSVGDEEARAYMMASTAHSAGE